MKYKNISGTDLFIPGIGKVEAGASIDTEKEISNCNFQKVEDGAESAPRKKTAPVEESKRNQEK